MGYAAQPGLDMRHEVEARMLVGADTALAYLADAHNLVQWTFGAMQPIDVRHDRCRSHSLLSGALLDIALVALPEERAVEYRSWRQDRPHALIIRAFVTPSDGEVCTIRLEVIRPPELADEDWRLICLAHELEIHILRNRLEALRAQGAASPLQDATGF